MFVNTTYRSKETEIMDDFGMEGIVLQEALDKIAKINQLLGGNKLTLNGVKKLIATVPKDRTITILDAGCGNGDMLRELAFFGKKYNYNFQLIGIDANEFTIAHAKNLSNNFNNIKYYCEDIFKDTFNSQNYDIVLCTLTLHHFNDEEIQNLLKLFYNNTKIGIVINDLQRSALAYRLFQLICFVFQLNYMTKNDGLVSILRGFKKEELEKYSKKNNFNKYTVHWKWAFRYQWLIQKK